MLGFVFGRTIGFGLRAGGFSCTPILGATMGLKVLMVSLEELVLRRIWGSELRKTTLWRGLSDSVEVAGVGLFFICSKVSSTTSGACLAELCRSSSRSSFSAVFIVSSMSWVRAQRQRHVTGAATERTEQEEQGAVQNAAINLPALLSLMNIRVLKPICARFMRRRYNWQVCGLAERCKI